MYGGSRCACGREPAGQLPTSSTIRERAASTHGSSNVAAGVQRTHVRQVGGSGPGGGHVADHSIIRWSKLRQKGNGGRSSPSSRDRSWAAVGNASGSGTSGGWRSSWSSPSTSPTDHTIASSIGRPRWIMATRWANTVRPARNGVTTRSTGAKAATER